MQESHERPTSVRYGVLAAFCAAATIAYIQRNGLGVAVPLVTKDLGISRTDMGDVMGSFFITYSIFQIPGGWLATRWQTRRALTMFAVLWSMATAAIALAPNWQVLLAAQLAMGAAQAGLFPAATLSLTHWWSAARRGVATGALASFMSVGTTVGMAMAGFLLEHISWRMMFLLYALPGVIWAAWFHLWYRDDPARHGSVNAAELDLIERSRAQAPAIAKEPRVRIPWAALCLSWPMACICGQHVFRAAGYIFYPTWFPSYLSDVRGSSIFGTGMLGSLPTAAVIIGSPLGGMTSDWILRRTGSRWWERVFAACCMLLSAAFIVLGWRSTHTAVAVGAIAAGAFCAAFGGPCAYAITMDMGGRQVAVVFSLMNAVGGVGAFLLPTMVPRILKGSSWDVVMMMFAGIYVAAAVCWLAFDSRGTIVPEPSADHGLPKAV